MWPQNKALLKYIFSASKIKQSLHLCHVFYLKALLKFSIAHTLSYYFSIFSVDSEPYINLQFKYLRFSYLMCNEG